MKKGGAFTLSELIIALSIVGILCAIVLPTLTNNNPNQNKMMMKKVYSVFTDVVNDLINDTGNYPVIYGLCPDNGNSGYIGFDCTETDSKLPYLFSTRMTLSGGKINNENAIKTDANYSRTGLQACNGVGSSCYALISDDKMIWTFEKSKLTKGSYTDSILIGVDVNGDKKPNCYQGSTTESCKKRDGNFDQFRMKLYADGTIKINDDDAWAREAIHASSSLTK